MKRTSLYAATGWALLALGSGCPVSGEITGASAPAGASTGASAGESASSGGIGTGSATGANASGGTTGRPSSSSAGASTGAVGGRTTGSGVGSSSGVASNGGNGSTAGGASSAGSTGNGNASSGGGLSTTSGGGNSTGGVGTSGGGASSSGGTTGARCDRAKLTWDGPTENTDGSCISNLGWFLVEWGQVSGGPYPNQVNVGLPCTPGTPVACGSASGTIAPLTCTYSLTGLTNGPWYFVTLSVNTQGVQSVPSDEATVTIDCPCNGCTCTSGSDCPLFQMCDPSTGMCDTNCQGSGCACVADSQCAGGYEEQSGLGQGEICVNGFCTAGCNAATDCPLDEGCDLTNGAPGTCGCTGSTCACVIDTQCNQDDEGRQTDCGTNGLCVQGCKTGYDCPMSSSCDQSQGFIGSCENPCTSGDCNCIFNSQCTDGGVGLGIACLNESGLCGPGCATGDDCGTTEACDTPTNACSATCGTSGSPYQCACTADTQCNGGQAGQGVVCNNALCFMGCHATADCPSGMTCDLTQTPGTCS